MQQLIRNCEIQYLKPVQHRFSLDISKKETLIGTFMILIESPNVASDIYKLTLTMKMCLFASFHVCLDIEFSFFAEP